MSHYKTNLRDIEFNLFEVLGRDAVLGTGPREGVRSDVGIDRWVDVRRSGRPGGRALLVSNKKCAPRLRPVQHGWRKCDLLIPPERRDLRHAEPRNLTAGVSQCLLLH